MTANSGFLWPETYRQVLEHLPQTAVVVFDRELRFRLVAGSALADSGLERGKVEGRRLEDVVPSPAGDQLAKQYRRALAGETVSLRYRSTLNGRAFWLRILPLQSEDGVVVTGMAVTLDVTELADAESRVQETVKALEAVQHISGVGSWSWAPGSPQFELSVETYRIIGHDAANGPATSDLLLSCIDDADDRQRVVDAFDAVHRGALTESEFRLGCRISRLTDGASRWLLMTGHGPSRPGEVVVGTIQDVTELRQAELEANRQRDYVQAVIAAANDGILLSEEGKIVDVNPAMCRLVGFSREELLGLSAPYPFWAERAIGTLRSHLSGVADSGRTAQIETSFRDRDGAEVPVAVTTAMATHRPVDPVTQVSTVRDITVQKRQEAELRRLATRDALTGLLNQRAFHENIDRELTRSRLHRQPLSLALLDLDHFKWINDRHGHPVGDLVLEELSRRLQILARKDESMARLGGEEFGWILPDTAEAAAYEIAERARQVIAADPFPIVGRVTVSIGVCELDRKGDAGQLYARADLALYSAKQQGRNRTERFSRTT